MSKKPSKTAKPKGQQPEPARLKAIKRLLEGGDYPRATKRARTLMLQQPVGSQAARAQLE